MLVILYIQEYLCVFTNWLRVSKDFQFRVSGSRINQKRTALVCENNPPHDKVILALLLHKWASMSLYSS